MTLYSTILFLHVLGMLGLVTALGIEWVLLRYTVRAGSREEAEAYIGRRRSFRRSLSCRQCSC